MIKMEKVTANLPRGRNFTTLIQALQPAWIIFLMNVSRPE